MTLLVTATELLKYPPLAGLDAGLLEGLSLAAQTRIERECQRLFLSAERTEKYDGDGSTRLLLRNFPVTEVDSVTVADGEDHVLDVDAFLIDEETGILYFDPHTDLDLDFYEFPKGTQNVTVKYTGGFTAGSDTIGLVKTAVGLYVVELADTAQAGSTTSSESLGDYSISKAIPTDAALPAGVRQLIGILKDRKI
jgi:hypothetical protein